MEGITYEVKITKIEVRQVKNGQWTNRVEERQEIFKQVVGNVDVEKVFRAVSEEAPK